MSKQLVLYGLTGCSTCRKARQWLEEHAVPYTFVDYREEPLNARQLTSWSDLLGGWPKLANRASRTWRQLPDALKQPETDRDWLRLIASHPTLVRRPVAWDGEKLVVGFKPARYAEAFL